VPSGSVFVGKSSGEQAAMPTQSLPDFVSSDICDIRVESSESSGGSSGTPSALASLTATCGVSVTKTGHLSGCS